MNKLEVFLISKGLLGRFNELLISNYTDVDHIYSMYGALSFIFAFRWSDTENDGEGKYYWLQINDEFIKTH